MRGYWEDAERTARGDRRGRLDAQRRPRDDRCRGLLQHRRPRQGHADPRRRERLPARDRGVSCSATRRCRRRRCSACPIAKYGEEVCAWIVAQARRSRSSEDEIRDFCRGQIAHYKVPRYVRFVDELPLTATGKAQKFVMREAMMRELGLTDAAHGLTGTTAVGPSHAAGHRVTRRGAAPEARRIAAALAPARVQFAN